MTSPSSRPPERVGVPRSAAEDLVPDQQPEPVQDTVPDEVPDEVPWLDDAEQRVWRQWLFVTSRLPTALNAQLQTDSDLSLQDFEVLVALDESPENRSRIDNAREARKQVLKYGALYPESETLAWENASANRCQTTPFRGPCRPSGRSVQRTNPRTASMARQCAHRC